MSAHHAQPGELIDVRPLADKLASSRTHALLKTPGLEVIRLILPAGKVLAEHAAPGDILVHCLEGRIRFTARGTTSELRAGDMLYLTSGELHAVESVEDASCLLTIAGRLS
jgi:quercetin dioxygenase-like cupin family protein